MSKKNKSIVIWLDFFSGRSNPSWELNNKEIEGFRSKFKDLPVVKVKKDETVRQPYRGFIIENKGRIKGIPELSLVANNTVSFMIKKKITYFKDINNIEGWLFDQAKKQGHEKIVDRILSVIESFKAEKNNLL